MQDDDDVVIKVEKTEPVVERSIPALGDDDDDVIVMPSEEQVVTEILDESEINGEAAQKESVITDDDVMIQEPKIETQLVLDDDEDDQPNTSVEKVEPMVVKIKEEPKDDGYEDLVNEEDAFVEVTAIANDDMMHGECFIDPYKPRARKPENLQFPPNLIPKLSTDEIYTNSPKTPFQPAHDENATFDVSSLAVPSPTGDDLSRDVDDENNSRPESSGTLIRGNKKLKIVLSSLAQTNLSNKNLISISNVNDQNENSNLDSVNKLDPNSAELQSDHPGEAIEEPEIEYQVKPSLQGVKFEKIKLPVTRGYENSGLCSIM